MDKAVTQWRVPYEGRKKGGKGYADQKYTPVVLLVPAKIDLKSYLKRLNHLEQELPSFFPAYAGYISNTFVARIEEQTFRS